MCTNEEQEVLDRNSAASHKLYRKLMGKSLDTSVTRNQAQEKSDYQKAVDHKNMLLEFDRTVYVFLITFLLLTPISPFLKSNWMTNRIR